MGFSAGNHILAQLHRYGMSRTHVHSLAPNSETRTAQYVAVNDAKKSLFTAMGDMSIISNREPVMPKASKQTRWIVIDANWSAARMRVLMHKCKKLYPNAKIAFEPVSVAKSTNLFSARLLRGVPGPGTPLGSLIPLYGPLIGERRKATNDQDTDFQITGGLENDPRNEIIDVRREPLIDLASPNKSELFAMHEAARSLGHFDMPTYTTMMDNLGISETTAMNLFSSTWPLEVLDPRVPLCAMQLLPYIPTIVTTLGEHGVLVTELLKPSDLRLTSSEYEPYIISRCKTGSASAGGVYMRHFPALNIPDRIVSVNGVGDTFLGVLIAGISSGCTLDEPLINLAQEAACLTLRSSKSVSPLLGNLESKLYRTVLASLQKRNDEVMACAMANSGASTRGNHATETSAMNELEGFVLRSQRKPSRAINGDAQDSHNAITNTTRSAESMFSSLKIPKHAIDDLSPRAIAPSEIPPVSPVYGHDSELERPTETNKMQEEETISASSQQLQADNDRRSKARQRKTRLASSTSSPTVMTLTTARPHSNPVSSTPGKQGCKD